VLMPLKTVNKYWGTVNRESQSTIFWVWNSRY
jgi:hypothetical protein